MDLKCHIYEYVHDIICACYKFFCTPREFAAHMIFVGKARFQWNHRARWIVILNCSLKTNALKGHYETNSHFICGICVFYVNAHNLCIFKYNFKQINLPLFSNPVSSISLGQSMASLIILSRFAKTKKRRHPLKSPDCNRKPGRN